jgi:hypothetical protein
MTVTNKGLTITETEPVPIVKDFGTFTTYIREKNPSLARKTHFLTRKTLYEIDQLLSHPLPDNRPQTSEGFYPHLKLFYHLALRGTFFVKTPELTLQQTETFTNYDMLTPTEKYFFLLETFWVDSNWSELLNHPSDFSLIPKARAITGYLARNPSGRILLMKRLDNIRSVIWNIHHFWQYLSFFGLLRIAFVQDPSKKRQLQPASVTITDLGSALFPILHGERNLEQWNIPYNQNETESLIIFPGLSETHCKEEYEPFFKPFQRLFKENLQKTLPRREHKKGTFVFKVSLRKNIWRIIVVSSENTLEDFHDAIQDAFHFDKDHLYAFFMDSVRWSSSSIYGPECDRSPSADQVCIGDLGLHVGQQILYLFDFGDEWNFKVVLLDIKSEPGPSSPVIVEQKGESPEQYPLDDYEL